MNNENFSKNEAAGEASACYEYEVEQKATLKKGPIQIKIEALATQINEEKKRDEKTTGNKVRDAAMALILRNAGSEEWNNYMSLFGFNEEELAKLMPGKDEEKNEALAYLVGNGPCGGSTIDPIGGRSADCGLVLGIDENIFDR